VANLAHRADVPVLVVVYIRLARQEEQDAVREFGEEYLQYAARTPAFIPRWSDVRRQS